MGILVFLCMHETSAERFHCAHTLFLSLQFTKLARDLKVPGGIGNAGGGTDAEGDAGVPDLR